MRAVLFITGFLSAGFAISDVLANHDPEPAGALASLVLFCLLALISSGTSYFAMSRRVKHIPSKVASLVAGAASAIVFCAAVGSTYLGVGFWWALSLAYAVAALAAAALAFKGRSVADA